MRNRASTRLRARDIDRSTTCTALDNAYAEGQLSYEEHRSRIERARAARHLGDLESLVGDLQNPVQRPRPVVAPERRTAPGPGVVRWGVAIVGLVALAAVVWLVVGSSPADDEPAAAANAAPTTTVTPVPEVVPIIAPRVDMTTAAGFTEFLELYRAKFGDTLADTVGLYPDGGYIVINRAEEPTRARDWTFRGGFDKGSLSSRDPNLQVIDIATVNPEALATLLQQAPVLTGVRDGEISHVGLRYDRGVPSIVVYVDNEVHESDYVRAGFDGQVIPRPGR